MPLKGYEKSEERENNNPQQQVQSKIMEHKPQTKTVKMKIENWRSQCPIEFQKMFFGLDGTNNYYEDYRDQLAYEVFPHTARVQPFKDFIESLTKLESVTKSAKDIEEYKKIGVLTESEQYSEQWSGIQEAKEQRQMLYPKSIFEGDGNRLGGDKSEISALLDIINNTGGRYTVQEKNDNGDYTFVYYIKDWRGNILYEIYPCCPNCHTLLPNKWFDTKYITGYMPLLLVGPYNGGKTTYMTSLLKDNGKVLNDALLSGKWKIQTGMLYEKERFKIQKLRYENVERFNNGEFPEPTPKEFLLPPVYITIECTDGKYKGIRFLVCIFDCAGELIETFGEWGNIANELLPNMEGFIYLVEPKNMDKLKNLFISEKGDLDIQLQKPEEQGKIQRDNQGKEKSSADIINEQNEIKNPLESLNGFINHVGKLNEDINLKHIAYTIVKSDSLLTEECSEYVKEIKPYLSKPNGRIDPFDDNEIQCRNDIIKEFFEKVVVSDEDSNIDNQKIKNAVVSYSWNCVNVAKDLGNKKCEHDFVRIADPFVNCIIAKLKSLNEES